MISRLVLITPPATDPVSLDDAKAHLRVDTDDDDAYIQGLIESATAYVDATGLYGRCMMPQSWELHLNAAESEIEIPLPPLISVDSVTVGGVLSDAANYTVFPGGDMPSILRWQGSGGGDVIVRFSAGYPGAVPANMLQYLLMIIAEAYENRETTIRASSVNTNEFAERLLIAIKLPAIT